MKKRIFLILGLLALFTITACSQKTKEGDYDYKVQHAYGNSNYTMLIWVKNDTINRIENTIEMNTKNQDKILVSQMEDTFKRLSNAYSQIEGATFSWKNEGDIYTIKINAQNKPAIDFLVEQGVIKSSSLTTHKKYLEDIGAKIEKN